MKVPVVLRTVHVKVATDGRLAIDLDAQPYAEDRQYTRGDLRAVLDEITTQLGTPVRVEVCEHDGTTYADIATPAQQTTSEMTAGVPPMPSPASPATLKSSSCLAGTGFRAGEEVTVAYVLCTQTADNDGRTRVQLPPALLARWGHKLVLIGAASSTVAVIEPSG